MAELVNTLETFLQDINPSVNVLMDGPWHTVIVDDEIIGRFRGNPDDYKNFYAVRV